MNKQHDYDNIPRAMDKTRRELLLSGKGDADLLSRSPKDELETAYQDVLVQEHVGRVRGHYSNPETMKLVASALARDVLDSPTEKTKDIIE
jgi:hypothetical protein